ncbi:MAG TPA: outer membrane lipid asymmetry maintenance protein MlaD, partial [Rhodobacter sp.]|nr:outer membrane lipid asymmetry maintenance protein MlaD [Rhodobacter sp.]
MAENSTEVIAGGVVLAAAVAFLVYVGQSAGIGTGGETYPILASFRSVDGIGLGSDVRLAGVKVGTITGLDLNSQSFFADVTLSLNKSIQIPDDSAVVISSEGLLGGNFIEILPGGSENSLAAG